MRCEAETDKQLETADFEKVYFYDQSRECYTAEFSRKGRSQGQEHVLTVCLLDAESESDWKEPFVEGDSSCIPSEMLKDTYEELRQWREKTGNHLQLFT